MRTKVILLATVLAFIISGCGDKKPSIKPSTLSEAEKKSPYPTRECINELSHGGEIDHNNKIDKIVVYKKKRVMYTYKDGKKVDKFRMSLGAKGGANGGNKVKAGDYRTPEGSYTITRKKCDNRLYKSLLISYPTPSERSIAKSRGVNPGGYITIHGQPKWNADGNGDEFTLSNDWTEGCMAVPNKAMDILWSSVQNGIKIDIHP